MSDMDFYLLLHQLFAVWLPWAVVVAVVLVTVIRIRQDRYNRRLSLEHSAEQREIELLIRKGAVSEEEGKRLLASCNALPEVREAFPLPNLHLKLVSAFGRIFSVAKLVLLAGNLAALFLIWVAAWKDGGVVTYAKSGTGSLWLLLLPWAGILLLSVLEFIASVRLLRGSSISRNFLIFSWIVNFALLRFSLVWMETAYYIVPVLGCGIYSLYILILRRVEVRKSCKVAVAAAALVAIWCGTYYAPAHFSHIIDKNTNWSSFMTSSVNMPVSIDEIRLIQGSPDEETLMLCRMLAAEIGKRSPFPCNVQTAGDQVELTDPARTLSIILTRGSYRPPVPANEREPDIFDAFFERSPAQQAVFQNEALRQVKNFLMFHLQAVSGRDSATFLWHGLTMEEGSPFFSGSYVTGSRSGNTRKMLEYLLPVITNHLEGPLKLLEQNRITLPEIAYPELAPPPFELDDRFALLYKGQSLNFAALYCWTFEITDVEKERAELTEFLRGQGFEPDPVTYMDTTVEFKSAKKGKLFLKLDGTLPEAAVRYGMLTYARTIWGKSKAKPADEQFLKKLLADDPESFLVMKGLQPLRGRELEEAFDKLLATGTPAYREKKLLWESTTGKEAIELLGPKRRRLLGEMITETQKDSSSEFYLERIKELFRLSEDYPEERAMLKDGLKEAYATVFLPESPDENGLYVYKAKIYPKPNEPAAMALAIPVPGRKDFFVFGGFFRQKNGEYRFEHSSGSSFNMEKQEEYTKWEVFRYEESDWNWTISTKRAVQLSQVGPGQIAVYLKYRPDENCFEVEVYYRPAE